MYGDSETQPPGVYAVDEQGGLTLVHAYQNDEYSLEDALETFGFGRAEDDGDNGNPIIVLEAREVRELKVNADAYSFDYDEGFIEMCLDIERYSTGAEGEAVRLVSLD